uniref:Translation factor GUF1 likeic n=1 Tax=Rhizophora mucronata TaxID=61149 RepID=A0A2P2MGJ4_RHIMU
MHAQTYVFTYELCTFPCISVCVCINLMPRPLKYSVILFLVQIYRLKCLHLKIILVHLWSWLKREEESSKK